MSDTPMEHNTNFGIALHSFGDVFIGGLGLGMVVDALNRCDEVTSITVVEKSADVIALIHPHVASDKLTVIHDDVFTFKPDRKFDVLYFDIWPSICVDNLKEMATLHRRYGRFRTKSTGSWMDSWCRGMLLAQRRREQRHDRMYAWR